MCSEIVQEGEAAVFKIALNPFWKGTCRASWRSIWWQQPLGCVAVIPWPRPEWAQYWAFPVSPRCSDSILHHQASPIKGGNLRMNYKKSNPITPAQGYPCNCLCRSSAFQYIHSSSESREPRETDRGFAAHVWPCSMCGKWQYVWAAPDFSFPLNDRLGPACH